MAVGIGLSVNNARAVLEALRGRTSEFRRTPKYNLPDGADPADRRYRIGANRDSWIELSLAVYFAVACVAALASGLWAAVPFLLLFEVGYAYTALSSLGVSKAASRRAKSRHRSAGSSAPAWHPSQPTGVTTKPLARASESTSPEPALRARLAVKRPSVKSSRARW